MPREPGDDAYADLGGQVDEYGARIPKGKPIRQMYEVDENGARVPRRFFPPHAPVVEDRGAKPSTPGSPLQLVSEDVVEEDIASMCRIYGVYVTAGVLGQYREILGELPPAAIHEAVKQWLRNPPEKRAAYPHELRALAEKWDGPGPGGRPARPVEPPPPKLDLDQMFTELAAENPQNPMFLAMLRRREKARAQGQLFSAAETAGLIIQEVVDGIAMPIAGDQHGAPNDGRSANAPAED